ncbi:MAG: hypothetical protein GXP55_03640 [Deltaproteobacteria bacterium]|nr:hypothetical protein [Deltaproteobacteria bacterium]
MSLRLSSSLLLTTLTLSLGLFGAACGSSESATPPTPAQAAATPAAAEPTAEPADAPPDLQAASEAQGDNFELSVSGQDGYAAGELSSFSISLTPRGEWHVNQEYPLHIVLAAEDGVTLPKTELERGDAAEYGERAVRFDVPFTAASAGAKRVAAKVFFAVCTDENCMPQERTVALALSVQ